MASLTALNKLSDEELQKIALKKNRRGCATQEALRAQQVLYYRANPFGKVGGARPEDAPYGTNDGAENR